MRKYLKKTLFLTAIGFAALGFHYGSARIIPGIDRPFDPPNYYSPTSISWADTMNPSFFFRDLRRQGMHVHDVPREVKNNLALHNTLERLNVIIAYVGNKVIDMTGWMPEKSSKMIQRIETIAARNQDVYQAARIGTEEKTALFRTLETAGDPRHDFEQKEQYLWMDAIYGDVLYSTKNSITDVKGRAEALNTAIKNSAEAQGHLTALQSNTTVWALYQAEIQRENALLSNYAALEAAHDMAERDKALKSAEMMKQGMYCRVSDPYHPAKTDEKNYTRPKGLGFVDLK